MIDRFCSFRWFRDIVAITFLTLVGTAFQARAALTEEVTMVAIDSPAYVLDSDLNDGDPATLRNGLFTNALVEIDRDGLGDPTVDDDYRVIYQLLDQSGTALSLKNSLPGQPTFGAGPSFPVERNIFDLFPFTRVEEIYPDPLVTLDNKESYRVIAALQKRPNVFSPWVNVAGSDDTSPPSLVHHFTETASGDVEYNIKSVVSNLTWNRKFALQTNAGLDHFEASIEADFSRYDNWDSPITVLTTIVEFDFDLIEDSTGISVPLENDGITQRSLKIASYLLDGLDKVPAFRNFVQVSDLKPLSQLRSGSEEYTLRCTVRHREQPLGPLADDAVCELAATGLLHFNGNLSFGAIDTTFIALANNPTYGFTGPNSVATTIRIPLGGGMMPDAAPHVYGQNQFLQVSLFDDGDAILVSGNETVYLPPFPGNPVRHTVSCLTYQYGPVSLGTGGISTNSIEVELPQGLIYLPDTNVSSHHGETTISQAGAISLASNLNILSNLTIPLGSNAGLVDESQPLLFGTGEVVVRTNGSLDFKNVNQARYIHERSFDLLAANLSNGLIEEENEEGLKLVDRASNDRYYRKVLGVNGSLLTAKSASDKSSRLNVSLDVAAIKFQTHFPAYVDVDWQTDSEILIDDGVTVGTALQDTFTLELSYHQTCPVEEDPCAKDVEKKKLEVFVDTNKLNHTPTGGLYTTGILVDTEPLAWGARGDGNDPGAVDPNFPYAHRSSDFGFTEFFMPGYQLYAADNVLLQTAPYASGGGDFAPGALLLTGFNSDLGDPKLHLATTGEYLDGDGSYPGLNFQVTSSNEKGASRLGGATTDYDYQLLDNGATKYYTRCAGIFGRQVAVEGTFDSSLTIYDYDFELTSFQLSFIASQQEKSWINGAVSVSGHSDFSQRFLGLNLTCLGELSDAELDPEDKSVKNLVHWNSTFEAKSMRFETTPITPPGACPVLYKGFLTMGIKTQVAHIAQPLYGTFAFDASDGNLLTQSTGAAIGVDCELGLPSNIPMDGPSDDYTLVPVGKLRYSNPDESGIPPGDLGGYVNFAATINVPYFRDLQVHVMTSANGIPVPPSMTPPSPPLYLAPGWDVAGKTFFNSTTFDPNHASWPKGAIDLSEYQSPSDTTNPDFLIKAEQDLFGIIGLSYPLRWTDGTRHFESMIPDKDELFIIDIEHQVDYLDADATKVSFGAKYDGLPEISLTSMLNDQIDGASEAVSDAIGAPLKSALDKAFEEFEAFLADSLDAVIDPIVDEAAEKVLCPLYDELDVIYQTARASGDTWADFENQLNAQVAARIYDTGAPLFATELQTQLKDLADVGAEAASVTSGLKDALEKMITGLDVLVNEVELDAMDGTPVFRRNVSVPSFPNNPTSPGFLMQDGNGDFDIVEKLIKFLLENVAEPEVAAIIEPILNNLASELNAELNALLETHKPKLIKLAVVAQQVRTVLKDIYEIVDISAGFISDFNVMVNQAITAVDGFQEIMAKPATRVIAFFEDLAQQNGINIAAGTDQLNDYLDLFEEFDKEAFIATIKTELKDALIQSELMQQFKYLVRQTLYDVQAKFEQAVAIMLAQVTTIMKELISETVGALEDQINPLLGQVNEYMGAAEIKGYAEFNGDSLVKMRLDASMQFKIPDEMQLNVFLEICTYTSQDENACLGPGEKTVEITVGALDVPFDWISDGLKASLSVKMSLKTNPMGLLRPHGVGGSFEITDGTIDFQSFKITCFKVTMAVGGDECYLGARACGIFNSYEMSIGVFFGRTCTPAPLVLVDSDVGNLFDTGDMPLTGVYIYGEVWLPISEIILGIPASCLFNISAGVGAGVGFFVDDSLSPIFVGKMFAGISGEALCIVSIKGTVTLVGIVQDGSFSATGTGKLSGKAGWCPFCVKFSVSAKISYKNGDWDVDY